MKYDLVQHNKTVFIQLQPGWQLTADQSAVDLIGICAENDTSSLLIGTENLPETFYDLRTGLAGAILGRFSIYQVRAGFVIPTDRLTAGHFGEMVWELNHSDEIHFSDNLADVIDWLSKS
jgi:PadR family transcriptional regulator, regulatory protein AphA